MLSIATPSMRYHYQGGNITGDEVMATSGLEAGGSPVVASSTVSTE